MRILRLLAFVFHAVIVATPTLSAEFFLLPGTKTLYILGEIGFDDFAKFQEFLEQQSVETVGLAGPGGSLDTSFAIGNEILKRGLSTTTISGRTCASACTIIFLHGKTRHMEEGTELGIHTPFLHFSGMEKRHFAADLPDRLEEYCISIGVDLNYIHKIFPPDISGTSRFASDAACLTRTYQIAFRDAKKFINFFNIAGVDDQVLADMLETGPYEMRWYGREESEELGITKRLSEKEKKAAEVAAAEKAAEVAAAEKATEVAAAEVAAAEKAAEKRARKFETLVNREARPPSLVVYGPLRKPLFLRCYDPERHSVYSLTRSYFNDHPVSCFGKNYAISEEAYRKLR